MADLPSAPCGGVTEIGSDRDAKLVSASCTCGWAEVTSYARPTGEPVGLRLVRLKADLHQAGQR